MTGLAHRIDPLPVWLGLIALAGWSVAVLGANGMVDPAFCAGMAPWRAGETLDLALALNPPARLAAGWALMLAAMMPPLAWQPLTHVRDRGPGCRAGRSVALFGLGYGAVWMMAGVVLAPLALALDAAIGAPLALTLIAAAAALWQASPAKQACLNRRHRQPPLAAFGRAADLDALRFGMANGMWCVGVCWALMLLPLLVSHGHLPAMAACGVWLIAEHLDPPAPLAWRWRWPAKAVRLVLAQARLRPPPVTSARRWRRPA